MDVAIVAAEPDSVGELSSAAALSGALIVAGHQASVHVPQDPANLSAYTEELHRTWSHRPPDVAHAQSWLSGMAAQSAARGLDIPVVQSFRAVETVEARKLVAVLARRASWVAATNNEQLVELLQTGCSRSRLSVIPCGVDGELFAPPGPVASRGVAHHRMVSVWTTALRPSMALAALASTPDAEWVVAVDSAADDATEVESRLRPAAEAAGVADRLAVEQVSDAPQLAALLRSADVFVCPVTADPAGAAVLQAMSCAVPVVGTAVGALVDIVVDDVTGRLVPPGDAPRFVEAVRRLLHEPFAGRGMGGAGRDRACSRYSWERVAADAVRAYAGALGPVGAASA
ncbi:hypothetical protein BVC93_29490 [Mycobacterium sp. MS1601]|uniref:glycosyltransferase n=1 Tax=Mycobacterium sp. MS1601 TaxID=1936029 RepID=UPI00097910F5|nr:glycosyltransferase [Mycobacterium sp. MS1601]AQA05816.1 hypothetical protein BVC93_29490 [Mycobacterium sp. MS1601]